MTGLFVCLARAVSVSAETPDLPPIEAPPEGTAPEAGAFSQPTKPPPAAAAAAPADAGAAPEFVIPLPGGTPDTTPPAATLQPAPAAEPQPEFTPTRPATPTTAQPAPAEPAPEAAATPSSDLPPEILMPTPGATPPAAADPSAQASAPKAAPNSTPAPTASAPAPAAAPVLPEPLALEEAWHVRFVPFAAMGLASDLGNATPTETTLPTASLFSVGAKVGVSSGAVAITGRFSDSFYQQRYLTTQLATQGGLSTLDVSEQKLNVDLDVGYELMHHIDPKVAKYVTLAPFVGGGVRLFISDSLPMNFVGPEAGARLAIAPTSSLVIALGYTFVPNLLSYQGPKLALGTPKYDHGADVDISLRLLGGARGHLTYQSEYLTLTSAYRAYQSVGVGFDYGF